MNNYSNQNLGNNQKQNPKEGKKEVEPIKYDWINNGINKEAVEWAKKFGEELAKDDNRFKKLTTSQLRKFFGQ